MDDYQLIENYVERGDEEAFGELVHRHLPLVLGVAKRLVHDHSLAEDVCQQTFTALVRNLQRKKTIIHLRSWLYATARQQAIAFIRSESRRKAREQRATTAEMKLVNSEPSSMETEAALDEA
ncbi:MAG: sigma-70 family RNA polymerase sigma factor, partial [Verrucomicrobiota bacterium]